MNQITPVSEVASLILTNLHKYGGEKQREITRAKMSENSICGLSGHNRYLPEAYVRSLVQELHQRDWLMFQSQSNEYCFMALSTTDQWVKLSTKRIFEEDPRKEFENWTLSSLQQYVVYNDFLRPDEEGFQDKELLIAAIISANTQRSAI